MKYKQYTNPMLNTKEMRDPAEAIEIEGFEGAQV
jgi:hypothetical protein